MGRLKVPPGRLRFIWSSLDTFHCITRKAPAGFSVLKLLKRCRPNKACTCRQPIKRVNNGSIAQRDLINNQKKRNNTRASTIKGKPMPSTAHQATQGLVMLPQEGSRRISLRTSVTLHSGILITPMRRPLFLHQSRCIRISLHSTPMLPPA